MTDAAINTDAPAMSERTRRLQARLRGRYAREARFKWYGRIAIGIAVAVALPRVIEADRPRPAGGRFDVLGAVTVMAGLVALVYGIDGAAEHGWGSARTLVPVAAATVLLTAFAGVEKTGKVQRIGGAHHDERAARRGAAHVTQPLDGFGQRELFAG